MTPEDLQSHFDTSPAIRLLQANSAPFVISFLHQRFKQARTIDLPHSELVSALSAFQDHLREAQVYALKERPEEYLRDWTEKRWLHRFIQADRNEPAYQLTPHSEQVIDFLDRALDQDLGFVGAQSRLLLIMKTLNELVVHSSDDPEIRLAHLREEQAKIARQIEEIEQHGAVPIFNPTRIREQFGLAVRLFKELQSDFRGVEEKFKEITREVQKRQAQGVDTRGGILGDVLGAEAALKEQDQGVSFFEFLRFIQSPKQQDRLQSIINELLVLKELADQTDGRETMRHMVTLLLGEADKVLHTERRLSASLRRLLDFRTHDERRRVSEVLRNIRVYAAALGQEPPKHIGVEVDEPVEISAPLSRTDWAPPVKFEQVDLRVHVADEALRQKAFQAFLELRPIDWIGLRRRISLSIVQGNACTLGEVLAESPPEGIIDILAYLQIACEDGHLVRTDATEEIALQPIDGDGKSIAVTIPLVTFIAKGEMRERA